MGAKARQGPGELALDVAVRAAEDGGGLALTEVLPQPQDHDRPHLRWQLSELGPDELAQLRGADHRRAVVRHVVPGRPLAWTPAEPSVPRHSLPGDGRPHVALGPVDGGAPPSPPGALEG